MTNLCKTCGAQLRGSFCHQCGEKVIRSEDFAIRHFFAEFINQVFLFDGRFFKSFWLLLRHPGLLTREYLDGRRKPYLKPLQMFIIANVIYFIVQPHTIANTFNTTLQSHLNRQLYSPLARMLIHPEEISDLNTYVRDFNFLTHNYARSLLFLMIPMVAGVLAIMNRRLRRYFFEYLIFATHYFTFALLYVFSLFFFGYSGMYSLLKSQGYNTAILRSEFWLSLPIASFQAIYLYPALRNVFHMSRLRASFNILLLLLSMTYLLFQVYRLILFLVVYLMMGR